HRTVSRGGRGALLRVRLPAGRPVVLLRGGPAAEVRLSDGGRGETFAVGAARGSTPRSLVGARRARAGLVELRVLRGAVTVDGAAVRP
ncbi:hypothetical protein VSS74_16015, partial [Conexibacter stalactiti]